MSDALGYGFVQMLAQACHDNDAATTSIKTLAPFHSASQLGQYESCPQPKTYHSAKELFRNTMNADGVELSTRPVVKSGDWKLLEDMRGRPGWISTRVGSILSFPVCFGNRPFLSVAYLRSYEHIGNATFRIEDTKGNVQVEASLDGHWDKRYSLPQVLNLGDSGPQRRAAGAKFRSHSNMMSLQNGEYNVVFEVAPGLEDGSKVKLLSVSTC
jgi:hypothetical protein